MKRWKTTLSKTKCAVAGLSVLLGISILAGGSITAMAAGSIPSVGINFRNNTETPGEIQEPVITTSGSTYSISAIDWSREIDKWNPGRSVNVTITLVPASGYEFTGNYGTGTRKLNVSGASFDSPARVSEEGELVVKASYMPVVRLGETESAGWSNAQKTKAMWKKVTYANQYELRLYHNGEIVATVYTDTNTIDLAQYMKEETTYYYDVRARGKSNNDRKYMLDGEYVSSEDLVLEDVGDVSGKWSNDQTGSRYYDQGTGYVTNCWKLIYSKWYYFNPEGYVVKGWVDNGGVWYYTDSQGIMQTGWVEVNGVWYYLSDSGAMQTGWIQPQPNMYYYLNPSNGAMAVGWTTVDNKTYYMDGSGRMLSNTTVEGRYLSADGSAI